MEVIDFGGIVELRQDSFNRIGIFIVSRLLNAVTIRFHCNSKSFIYLTTSNLLIIVLFGFVSFSFAPIQVWITVTGMRLQLILGQHILVVEHIFHDLGLLQSLANVFPLLRISLKFLLYGLIIVFGHHLYVFYTHIFPPLNSPRHLFMIILEMLLRTHESVEEKLLTRTILYVRIARIVLIFT